MFFVLNVGRSGSRTLAQVLSQSPGCTCLHEPEPQLVEEAYRYRAGELDGAEISEILRATRHAPEDGGVYGETANKLSLVIPPLRAAFPDAALVWLVRDGRDMVSSALQRGWYGEDESSDSTWARHRPTAPLLDHEDPDVWAAWDQFERLCWYWARLNELIRADTRGADVLQLRLEDLDARIDEVAAHVGVQPTAFTITRANRRYTEAEGAPADAKRSNLVERRFSPDDWTATQRDTFDRHCGALMDELYPGWRSGSGASQQQAPPAQDTDRILVSLREELAEIRLGQHDLRELRRERDDLRNDVARLEDQLGQSVADVEEAARTREEIEFERRLRTSLAADLAEAQREQQELAHRVAELDERVTERDVAIRSLREQTTALRARLARADERHRRLTTSAAYRVADRVLRLRRRARRVVGRLLRLLFRVLPRRTRDRVGQLRHVRRRGGATPAIVPVPRLIDVPGQTTPADGALPLIALLLWDVTQSEVLDAIEQVRALQAEVGDFGPLFVTDATCFHLFREHRLVFEYVPPREEWDGHFPARPYEEFVSERLASLMDAYHPDQVIALDLGDRHRAASLASLRAAAVELHQRRARLVAASAGA